MLSTECLLSRSSLEVSVKLKLMLAALPKAGAGADSVAGWFG